MAGIGRSRFSESDSSSSSPKLSSDFRSKEVIEDKVFVAVGKKVSESKSTLLWALQNVEGKRICLLHVHQPSQTISVLGGKFPVSSLGEMQVRAHMENERKEMNKILDEYLRICTKAGVQAEKLCIDKDSIEKGIVELVSCHSIGELVMGGAADGRYSRKMIGLKSKKANYVHQHAPAFCHIWFICKQRLIHTREAKGKLSPMGHASMLSVAEFVPSSVISVSRSSTVSSNPESVVCSPLSPLSRNGQRETDFTFSSLPLNGAKYPSPSAPHILETSMDDKLHQQLMQAIEEVEISNKQVFEESVSRRRAEKDAAEAHRRARAWESLYMEEVSRKKAIEEELAKRTKELENIKNQWDTTLEELKIIRDQKLILEARVGTSDCFVHELGEKLISAAQFLQEYKEHL